MSFNEGRHCTEKWGTGQTDRELYQEALPACSGIQPRPSRTSTMRSQHSAESTALCAQCCQGTRRGWHRTSAKHMAIQCLPLVTYIAAWAFAQITSLNAAFKSPLSVSSASDPSFLGVSCFQYMSGRTKHTASSPLAISPEPETQPNPTAALPARISLFQGQLSISDAVAPASPVSTCMEASAAASIKGQVCKAQFPPPDSHVALAGGCSDSQ